MSYKPMPMWTVTCDEPGCDAVFEDEDEGFVAWSEKPMAEERAEGCDWYCRDGRHFCDEHGPEGMLPASDRPWPRTGGAA